MTMATDHWARNYVGTPWAREATCWDFFRRVQADVFGIAVPEIHTEAFDVRHLARIFAAHPERARWRPVAIEGRREGDGLLMASRGKPWHVGIWTEVDGGRVLHCPEGGAVLQRLADVRRCGWPVIEFYRFAS